MRVRNTVQFCLSSLIFLLASSQTNAGLLQTIRIGLAEDFYQIESTVNGQRVQDDLISPPCLSLANSWTVDREWTPPTEERQSNISAASTALNPRCFAIGCPCERDHTVSDSRPGWQWLEESLLGLRSKAHGCFRQARLLEREYRHRFLNQSQPLEAARIAANYVSTAAHKSLHRVGQIPSALVSGRLSGENSERDATVPVSVSTASPNRDVPETSEMEGNEGIDAYWQYYEDCDYWNVIFAALNEPITRSIAAIRAHRDRCLEENSRIANRGPESASRNVFPLWSTSQKLVHTALHSWQRQLSLEEFRVIESAGIDWSRIDERLSSGFQPSICSLRSAVRRHELVAISILNASAMVKTRLTDVFHESLVPLVQKTAYKNTRIRAFRRQIEFDKRVAHGVGWIGKSLVWISEEMIHELESQSSELECQSRLAQRAGRQPVN